MENGMEQQHFFSLVHHRFTRKLRNPREGRWRSKDSWKASTSFANFVVEVETDTSCDNHEMFSCNKKVASPERNKNIELTFTDRLMGHDSVGALFIT